MITPEQLESFCDEARRMGALHAVVVSPPRQVFTATWVRLRCQYGCSEYGQCLTCPPHSPTPETTRRMLDEYKAFAFLCGPCRLCKTCVVTRPHSGKPIACKYPDKARPAMEAAGIDVFATARAAGLPIEVVRTEGCPQNYYALVLVE